MQFIGGLAILIIVHELGHFLSARALGVDVEEFGIGFPPRLVKLFKVGGTIFSINWIPLGGFVRLKGENDPSVPGGLAAASPWVRLGVLFAGPLMNLAVGVLLAIVFIYSLGEPVLDRVQVQGVALGSPAEQAGLLAGDEILRVNGQEIDTVEQLHEIIYANLGQEVQITYLRGEQVGEVSLVPRNPPPEEGAIGISMGYVVQPTTWAKAIPGGLRLAVDYGRSVLTLPFRILRGEISPEEGRPVGYKGMFDIYQQIRNPLWFFMVISMSLGIFNLLPIPALDGGRILFILIEAIRGRRVDPQREQWVHAVGMMILLGLSAVIIVMDIVQPISIR